MSDAEPIAARTGGAAVTVRRLLVLGILFTLVVIAASGASGLLERVFDVGGRMLAGGDLPGLARSLAFTLIAGPLAVVLWAYSWRRLRDRSERESVLWGLYLAAMLTLALIIFVIALLLTGAALVRGDWSPSTFGTAMVWMLVWALHRWMFRHPERVPTRLLDVAPTVGWLFGLIIAVSAGTNALAALLDAAILGPLGSTSIGEPWWRGVLSSLVWCVGGAGVWAWHWFAERGRESSTGLARVALVAVTGIATVVLALGGIATTLFVGLRILFDRPDAIEQALDPLGLALACAAIGGIVWAYYRSAPATRPPATERAIRLAAAGVTLIATASGIGVIINSILASVVNPIAGSGALLLLLGGSAPC